MKINKKIKVLDFKLSKILNGGLFGAYKSKFSGNGMEFSEHRQYIFGDHVKNIDWKASSKTGEMYVKNYEEERELNVLFFLDNTESMGFGSDKITKKDLLIDIFYSLGLSAYYNNDNIGGVVYDEKNINFIDYKKSRENIYKIIDILEQEKNEKINKKNINKINDILNYLIKNKIKENLIFILTDATDQIDEKLLKLVSNKNDIVFINIFDYFENNLSNLLGDIVLNNGKDFLNIDVSNDKLDEYKTYRKNKLGHFKNSIEKNKLGYIQIDTKSDIFKELLGYFSKIKN